MPHRILVIDDDADTLKALARLLSAWGFEVEGHEDPRVAIERLAVQQYDAVLTDYTMPVLTGMDVLRAVIDKQPSCPTIFLTGYASVERAVEAMRIGAFHFLSKPFDNDELRRVITSAVQRQRPVAEAPVTDATQKMLLGDAPSIRQLRQLIAEIADTDATVLILGESGTGKEVVARALHAGSRRRDHSFIPVHCGAIPEALLESEMFGHVKGAFTGATQARLGRFQLADGGTLLLDEIGDMPLTLQVKLLRVLQERSFEPVGGSRTVHADVRVLAATNRNLEQLVSDGKFREDLFYRLHVIPLVVPPLRERRKDLPTLLNHFITRHAEARHSGVVGISAEAIECLLAYDWPGNVRELENLVERLVILRRHGQIEVSDLPERYRLGREVAAPAARREHGALAELPEGGIDLRKVLAAYEERLIGQALARAKGNKKRAGALLGLNRTTLVEKLKRMPHVREQAGAQNGDEADTGDSGDEEPEPRSR
jgi:DNA-binding NtrC family response regulator